MLNAQSSITHDTARAAPSASSEPTYGPHPRRMTAVALLLPTTTTATATRHRQHKRRPWRFRWVRIGGFDMNDEWEREMDDAFREIHAACDRILAGSDRSIALCGNVINAIQQMQCEARDERGPPVGFV